MFDKLFKYRSIVARHREGPMRAERLAYLTHLANQGYARSTLRQISSDLVVIVRTLGLASGRRKTMTRDEVRRKVAGQRPFWCAVRWLKFMGRLQQRPMPLTPCAKKIKAFADYMEREVELSPATIYSRCCRVTRLLDRLHVKRDSLHDITPHRIDMAFQKLLEPGGYSRETIQTCATTLRAFFRFAEAQGWCRKGLAESVRNPRVFSHASLPLGPSWDDVRRLLATTEGDQRHNIRARPILMLLAIYGLRAGEVSRLRIEDFDWEHEVFRVISSKTGRVRTYPLTRSVGDAILRYLQEVRPRSPHRELFLTLGAPFRPVRSAMCHIVDERLRSLHVSLPHYGPHALRHACAMRLLAAGLSLKEIGDQLGHVDPENTRIYAKVDLAGLRQVADFDMGGVL
ncbi:MAG: tyrosine-type recombinase/integrase [Planctomycetota bacterium]